MADNLNDQAKALSDQQLEEYLAKMSDFYDQQKPLLEKRHTHEKLTCEIEEFRLRGMVAKLQLANLLKPADAEPEKPKEDGSGSN